METFPGSIHDFRKNLEAEKDNMKSLISDISHQTKTPIANIKLYGELLEEKMLRENREAGELDMLRQIQNQTDKLEFLLQSLTKMSRLESGILEVCPTERNVKTFLESAAEGIAPKAAKKEIELKLECTEDFKAYFDKKWTAEALYNILDNAVKYSPNGSVIRIRAKKYELYGAIMVEDEGMGISEEEIPKIFQRFYRSERVQQEEGVGIGLYLAREILRKEDGYIKVTSKEGKGSSFAMYLPRKRE